MCEDPTEQEQNRANSDLRHQFHSFPKEHKQSGTK